MSDFQIFFTPEATGRLEAIARSDPKSARIVFDHLKRLAHTFRNDPHLSGTKFQGLKRHRIGKYRAIYRIMEKESRTHIITVDLRKSVYDN